MRLAKQMTLTGLAQKSGISKLTLINIEAGRVRPKAKTLEKLASSLGVPVDNLQGHERSG